MKITAQQNRQLHMLLNRTKLVPQKTYLVASYTQGRSESSADLTADEARQLIAYLSSLDNTEDVANTMRRKVLAIAHRLGWEKEGGKVDLERVDNWCINYGFGKKPLNEYAYNELPKLVSQLQTVFKSYIRNTKTTQ